ncbi:MAG TPA: tetratricopeptide repeat protein [Gemmatimonadaceae bacterium]|nr:tetratricopeptide repeat protein [Gemmatimonadaceae bacterium]
MSGSARFDELKKKFDENPRRYFAPLANEFRKSGDAEQAVMICEEFLPQQPGHMSGHIVYGQALYDLGRLDDARTVFETALTLDPENLIALRHLGDIARAHGDLELARLWYQRVLEADPRNEEVQGLLSSLDGSPAAEPPRAAAAPESAPPAAFSFSEPAAETVIEQSTIVELAPAFEPPSPPPMPPASPPASEPLLDLDMFEEPATDAGSGGRAEGFEAMEFTPPPARTEGLAGIADQLEPAEFEASPSSVAPLEGLEETALGAFDAHAAQASPPPLPDLEPLPGSEPAAPASSPVDEAASASDAPPVDLPPEVIAAEAELIDARAAFELPTEPSPEAAVPPTPPRVTPSQPFVTETMAELYVKQGFREQALDVYKLLLAASPDNERLKDRVAELQQRDEVDSGPNVREFFARIAARRPGEGNAASVPPANDDFASLDSFETVPVSAASAGSPGQAAPESAAPEVAPALQGLPMLDDSPVPEPDAAAPRAQAPAEPGAGNGSIDALFGERSVNQADASAASALAQAFGGEQKESPAISGRPARAAAGELSLDSVFRDGGARPPRSAQSFSFDQFFSESATSEPSAPPGPAATPSQGTGAQPEPAERNADDIEQFNSWLQGLKQK